MTIHENKRPFFIELIGLGLFLIAVLLSFGCRSEKKDMMSELFPAEAAQVPNPSFEEREGEKPAGWTDHIWSGEAEFSLARDGHTGERCLRISSENGADASCSAVFPIRPFSKYRFSAWIKTENLVAEGGRGALINLHGIRGAESHPLKETQDWTKVEMEFDSGYTDAVQLNCLFGGWGKAVGIAWFDDIGLEILSTRTIDPHIIVQSDKKGDPISPYIYGQFIEHLGRCIYGGIWAEMLEDRKFFYKPGAENSPWSVLGDQNSLDMIREGSYVGDWTPLLSLEEGESGLVHGGLGLVAGKSYTGRIVVAGDHRSAPIAVSLIWGEKKEDRDTLLIENIGTEYVKIPLAFSAKQSTDSGKLEIRGLGRGEFSIGTVSLMPADNLEGFRADTLRLLRELDSPVYRWPGGNFVSGYDWKDGIGDPDRRPPRKNPAWKGVEHNDVGIHEYIRFCRLIDTEPMITVNTGLGTVEAAGEEVEYCNGDPETSMGKLRAENGHPEPFGVVYWCVGNEMYGSWQLGHMPMEDYIKKHNMTVEAMRDADPTIQTVAVGSVGRWSEGMMAGASDHMEYISEHFYCQERPGLMSHVYQMPYNIRRIADAHRSYRESIPSLAGKDIRIALDEWNYWYGPYVYGELGTRYFLKDALGVAAGLHEYYRQSDLIYMANYAQAVNVIGAVKTTKTAAAFAATGMVLKLFRKEYGTIPVEISGSPEPLFAAAALTEDGNTLTLSMVNPTVKKIDIPVEFLGLELTGNGRFFLLSGSGPMSYNEPGKEPEVVVTEQDVSRLGQSLAVPPLSIALYRLSIEK